MRRVRPLASLPAARAVDSWPKRKGRYKKVLERLGGAGGEPGEAFAEGDLGVVDLTLSDGETGALIAGGWGEETVVDDGFKNHGQRVSTFVKLAKALGYSASVGAMQANFPENVEVEAAIPVVGVVIDGGAIDGVVVDGVVVDGGVVDGGVVDGVVVDGGLVEDDGAGDWTTVNLDVDGDGVITIADLEAALAGAVEAPLDDGVIDAGDGAVVEGDGAVAGEGAVVEGDGAVAGDGAVVEGDGAVAGDGAVVEGDGAVAGDGAVVEGDGAVAGDGAVVEGDGAVAGDGAVVEGDGAVAGDGAAVDGDGAVAGDGAVVEGDGAAAGDGAVAGDGAAVPAAGG